MTGRELHLVAGGQPGADVADDLAWELRQHPAGKGAELRARLAVAEADHARSSTRSGRARLRAADWLCFAGAHLHAGCRALAERVAP